MRKKFPTNEEKQLSSEYSFIFICMAWPFHPPKNSDAIYRLERNYEKKKLTDNRIDSVHTEREKKRERERNLKSDPEIWLQHFESLV